MRLLLRHNTGTLSLTNDLVGDVAIPPYAILSHTWVEGQEVTFQDFIDGTGSEAGYDKLRFCADQAKRDGLQHFWVDTCCINKSNDAESSREINDMFRRYRDASKCYVYLSDVVTLSSNQPWQESFRGSRWFTRGWTLQELLAPRSVEFFSSDRKRLGNKESLAQQIHEITGIPKSALRGVRLSEFTVEERFSWAARRQTKRPEDQVYSMLGIFDIRMPLYYGKEGAEDAHRRLRELIDKREKCLQDLRITDPRDDKKRIEHTKGGLLKDSYFWILTNSDFQQWRNAQQNALLWVKGDPGKGKTMLLCGASNELDKMEARTGLLCYFFCQATDARINTATAVLRGLIYMLVRQQPSLISHIHQKYDQAGKKVFEDTNAWFALQEIFTNILHDPNRDSTYLIIDAVDECIEDLPELLDLIKEQSRTASRMKWIISSRNWPQIEQQLDKAKHQTKISLELNARSVSKAVDIYTKYKVSELAQLHGYDDETQSKVLQHLSHNADGTFLWIALVCQALKDVEEWDALGALTKFPRGLDLLYQRMWKQMRNSSSADTCQIILTIMVALYRPITVLELISLVDLPGISNDLKRMSRVIGLCGSFLTIRDTVVYFVHQSAKEFLLNNATDQIYASGQEAAHCTILSRGHLRLVPTLLAAATDDVVGRYSVDTPRDYSRENWMKHLLEADLERLNENERRQVVQQLANVFYDGQRLLQSSCGMKDRFIATWFATPRYSNGVREILHKYSLCVGTGQRDWVSTASRSARALFKPFIATCARKWLTKARWDDVQYLDKSETEVDIMYCYSTIDDDGKSDEISESSTGFTYRSLTVESIELVAALEPIPKTAHWYTGVAWILMEASKPAHTARAIEYFEKALEISPGGWVAMEGLAVCLGEHLKQYDLGVRWMNAAVEHLGALEGRGVALYLQCRIPSWQLRMDQCGGTLTSARAAYESSRGFQYGCGDNPSSHHEVAMIRILKDYITTLFEARNFEECRVVLYQLDETPTLRAGRSLWMALLQCMWHDDYDIEIFIKVGKIVEATEDRRFIDFLDASMTRAVCISADNVGSSNMFRLADEVTTWQATYAPHSQLGLQLCKRIVFLLDTTDRIQTEEMIGYRSSAAKILISKWIHQIQGVPKTDDQYIVLKNKMEDLAKHVQDDQAYYRDSSSAILYGFWLREYEKAEPHEWKAALAPSMKQGLYLLSDDDPYNDLAAYAQIGQALLKAGDIDNASIALGIALNALVQLPKSSNATQTEVIDSQSNDNTEILKMHGSAFNTKTADVQNTWWNCNGPCSKAHNEYKELYFCCKCLDTLFCEDCIVLVRDGSWRYCCDPEHNLVQMLPISEEAQRILTALNEKDFSAQQRWLDDLKAEWVGEK